MDPWNRDQQYDELVRNAISSGEIAIRCEGSEHRRAPRFRLESGRIAVRVEPQFSLLDISAAGFAFLSEWPFSAEDMLHVIIQGTLAFQARVVASTLIETDSDLLETRYRVQCRFDDLDNGKQLLLLLKELERLGVAPTVS